MYTRTVERFGECILEQSVSVRAVPELIVGVVVGRGGSGGGCSRMFRQNFVPVLHTSGQTMLKCMRKQNLIKI